MPDQGNQNIYSVQQIVGILLFGIVAEAVLGTRVVGAEPHLDGNTETQVTQPPKHGETCRPLLLPDQSKDDKTGSSIRAKRDNQL